MNDEPPDHSDSTPPTPPDESETLLEHKGPPGSISRLRAEAGIRGDVSLPDEDPLSDIIAGAASAGVFIGE